MRSAIAAALALVSLPATVHALPAFARQTGLPCSACHTQHFPVLNAFGRKFKLDGYTLVGAEAKVEGARLSIPAILNAALFMKMRYLKSNGADLGKRKSTNSGELQFPDEFSVFFAGRVSENIGFLFEGQLPTDGAALMAGFKIPFSYTVGSVRASVIPFSTDAIGAAYGLELMSTGAARNIRFMEQESDFSAQQYVGTGTPASGAAFAVGSHRFFANYTRWSPVHLASSNERSSPLPGANYARVAWLPTIGSWDVGIGAQRWYGVARIDDGHQHGEVLPFNTRAWAFDGQAMGKVGKYPVGLFGSVARSDGSGADQARPNFFNPAPNARSATSVATELGVWPQRGSILLGYRAGDNGEEEHHKDNAVTLGGIYHLHQNVQFQLNWTLRSGTAFSPRPPDGNRLLTLVLSAAM